MSGVGTERYEKLQERFETLNTRAKANQSLIPNSLKDGRTKSANGRDRPRPTDALAIRERAQKSFHDTNKRLKVIDEHMWQHRQQERELKRAEMDIVRQQKLIRQALKEAETSVTQKEGDQLQWLKEQEKKFENFKNTEQHRKKETSQERKDQMKENLLRSSEQIRKQIRNETEKGWRYQQLMKQLELRQTEVDQLSKDFENRIRAKEEEQHHLKQQMAELAIQINTDTHKTHLQGSEDQRQQQLANAKRLELERQRGEALAAEETSKQHMGARYERNVARLSQSLTAKQRTLQGTTRKEGHELAKVQVQLKHNLQVQQMGQKAAKDFELDAWRSQSNYRVELANNKRLSLVDRYEDKVRAQNRTELQKWEERIGRQQSEQKKKQHADRLRQLQKTIGRFDEHEHALYAQVKTAEASRKKQDQVVGRLQTDLEAMKRENARRLKDAAIKAQKAEIELEQKLLRESAELTKVLNLREEGLKMLAHQRNVASEERWMLQEEHKEHQRQHRIIQQTDMMS